VPPFLLVVTVNKHGQALRSAKRGRRTFPNGNLFGIGYSKSRDLVTESDQVGTSTVCPFWFYRRFLGKLVTLFSYNLACAAFRGGGPTKAYVHNVPSLRRGSRSDPRNANKWMR
jgi:hypothetical protein